MATAGTKLGKSCHVNSTQCDKPSHVETSVPWNPISKSPGVQMTNMFTQIGLECSSVVEYCLAFQNNSCLALQNSKKEKQTGRQPGKKVSDDKRQDLTQYVDGYEVSQGSVDLS